MSVKSVLGGLCIVALLLLPVIHAPSGGGYGVVLAQAARIEASLENNTLTVDTEFYSIKLNASVSGIIEDITVKSSRGRIDVFDNGLPSIFSATIWVLDSNGEPLEIDLSSVEWNISVLENTSSLLVASFSPSLVGYNASIDVRIIASFRASIPYFTYLLAVRNSGEGELSLSSPRGSVAVRVGFNNTGHNVSFTAYTIAGGYRPVAFTNETELTWIFGQAPSTIIALASGEEPVFAVMTRPLNPVPERALARTEGNSSVVTILYPNATLKPLESMLISIDVGYIPADPVPLALAGIADALDRLGPEASSLVEDLIRLPSQVEAMNRTIQDLEERVESLQERVENLTDELKNYQGIESFYKSDIRKLQDQVNRLRGELRSSNERMIAGIAGGIILGFIGGLIARRRY